NFATLAVTAPVGQAFTEPVAIVRSTESASFTSVIAWGDGHTSAGSILEANSTCNDYLVLGTNTYDHAGTYAFSVTLTTDGLDRLAAQGTAFVSKAFSGQVLDPSDDHSWPAAGQSTDIPHISTPFGSVSIASNGGSDGSTPAVSFGGGATGGTTASGSANL